jgi:hypothetical protein
VFSVIHKKKEGWSVLHYRIYRGAQGYTTDEKSFFASLEELISAKKKEFGLAKPVSCSRFVLEKMPSQTLLREDQTAMKASLDGSYVLHL